MLNCLIPHFAADEAVIFQIDQRAKFKKLYIQLKTRTDVHIITRLVCRGGVVPCSQIANEGDVCEPGAGQSALVLSENVLTMQMKTSHKGASCYYLQRL